MRLLAALCLTLATLFVALEAQAQAGFLSGTMRSTNTEAIANQQTTPVEDITEQIDSLSRSLSQAEREVAEQRARVNTLKEQGSDLALIAQRIFDVKSLSVQRYHHAIDGLRSMQRLASEIKPKQRELVDWQPPLEGPPWAVQFADDTYLLMTQSQVLADQYLLHDQMLRQSREALLKEKQGLEARLREIQPNPGISNDLNERQSLRAQLIQAEIKAVSLELVFADIFVQTNELNRLIAELTHQISRKDWQYMDNRFYLDQAAFERIEQQVEQNISSLLAQEGVIRQANDAAIIEFNQASVDLQAAQVAEPLDPQTLLSAERAVTLASDNAKLQRQRRDIAFYRYEMLEIAKNLWQIRYAVYQNNQNSNALKDLNTLFGNISDQIQDWEQYNATMSLEMQRERQGFLDGAALSPTKAEGDFLRQRAAFMQQRIDTLAQAVSHLNSTQFLLNITLREIEAFAHNAPLLTRVLNLGGDLTDIAHGIWHYEIFTVSDTVTVEGRPITTLRSVTVGKSIGALLILVVGLLLIKGIVSSAMKVALRRNRIGISTSLIITRWASLLAGMTLIIFSLILMDIPLSIFAFAGGALAIGIGFGAQQLLQNLISGLMLLIEKPVRVGDWIEVGGVTGTVTSIGIRFSTLMSPTGTEHLIPNSVLVQEKLVNWTYSSPEIRREIEVWVHYSNDSETISNLLISVAADHPVVLESPGPRVLLDSFTERGMLFKLQFWAPMLAHISGPVVMSEVRREIHARFTEYNIEIAYPQQTVTIKPEATTRIVGSTIIIDKPAPS